MTNEIETTTILPTSPKIIEHSSLRANNNVLKTSTKLEENRKNIKRPLSLRPNRSLKKTISLKPLDLRSR